MIYTRKSEKNHEVVDSFVKKLRYALSGVDESSVREEAQLFRGMLETYEEAKAKWSEAFAESAANVSAENETGETVRIDDGREVMYSEGGALLPWMMFRPFAV